MGNTEEGKAPKSEKSPPPVVEHNNMPLYPDWAAMQAYYGPRFAVPPYMNPPVASPHAPPPYMWGPPQSMIPPYGAPYAAFYPHGGVYAHPGVPLAGPAVSVETPTKSSADGGFVKKLKEFDGLAISIGNGNGDSTEHGSDRKLSDSDETAGSSDGSNGVTPRAGQSGRKRSVHGSPKGEDDKVQKKSSSVPAVEAGEKKTTVVPPANKPLESMNTKLELNDLKSSPTDSPQPVMNESWLQNERELKRERRKQSNRESARRSRLRKQAETEELAVKVQALTAESLTLKSEVNKLMENSERLKLENAALMAKLEANLGKIDKPRVKPVGTVNLLARVNNSDSSDRMDEDTDSYENRSPGAKLHQLLDTSSRSGAVAAG